MTVSFHGNVKEHTQGAKSIEVADTQSVRTLIDLLGERFGGPFREFLLGDETCFFLVNGSGIMATGGLNTPLHAGDTVEVLPCGDGGSYETLIEKQRKLFFYSGIACAAATRHVFGTDL